ncbi:MAG: hypothetical protein HYY16_11795 [Planctomycetes bacterium]|nr:hypothetical protein [Planctomycetota bacterium]
MRSMKANLIAWLAVSATACAVNPEQGDLEGQAARYGVNYPDLVQRARTDDDALRGFMLLRLITDACGSEAYGSDLLRLLEIRGDGPFAAVLLSVTPTVKANVLDALLFELGPLDTGNSTGLDFQRRFPLVSKAMFNRD